VRNKSPINGGENRGEKVNVKGKEKRKKGKSSGFGRLSRKRWRKKEQREGRLHASH